MDIDLTEVHRLDAELERAQERVRVIRQQRRDALREVTQRAGVSRTAEALGVSRQRLHRLIKGDGG